MWRATIKGILAHKVRLGLTALAIVLGVGFVAGTYMLTDTMNSAFDGLFREINHGVAVDVSGQPQFKASGPGGETAGTAQRVPAVLLDSIRQVPGVKDAVGNVGGYAQLVGKDGKAITTGGAPTIGLSWVPDPELSSLKLIQGRAPEASGEIAIDAGMAQKQSFRVGDRAKVLLQGPSMEATIVGIFKFGSSNNLLGATLVAFDPTTAQTALDAQGKFDDIAVSAQPGVSPDQLRDRIEQVLPPGFQAKTGVQAAEASAADVKKNLQFFNIALLVFAGISVFVGAFIIFNTFSILVAQRTRELALLRALGASPSQVRRSVMIEALVVGTVASLIGLAFGFLIAIGLQSLLKAFGLDLPSTTTKILPRTVIVSMAVGVLTTLFSSIAPAIRASRVAPVAAMRDAGPSTYTRSGRRTVSGAVVTVAGIGALLLGLFGSTGNGASLVGLGAALVFLGVAILSPLIARPLARILGAPLPKVSGVPGKLGRENAMRNPKRTASTAAALMIGLGLVGFVSILAASLKASTAAALAQTLKADYIVTSTSFTGFSQDVAGRLRNDPTFNAVEEFRQGIMGYVGTGVRSSGSGQVALPALQVTGVDPATLTAVTQVPLSAGSIQALGDGGVLVYSKTAESHGWRVGDTITVRFASSGNKQLKVVGIYTDQRLLGQTLISLDTFDQNFTQHLDTFVLVTTAPGVSQAQAKAAVTRVAKGFPNVRLQDQAEFRKTQAAQINQVLGLVTALLFLSVIIAVFGIMNTLGLSIYERTRELGLLRAVGMARRQVRMMVRWESMIIAVFGAILGIAVGFFFGWAMVRALRSQGLGVLSIPGGQLVIYILLAAWFGLIAAALPARRAAKLDVLRAIATE